MAEPARKLATWSPPPASAAPRRLALYADALPGRPIAAAARRWPNLRWLAGQLLGVAAIAGALGLFARWIWR